MKLRLCALLCLLGAAYHLRERFMNDICSEYAGLPGIPVMRLRFPVLEEISIMSLPNIMEESCTCLSEGYIDTSFY